MKLEPTVLQDRFVRLEPFCEAHREPLRAACAADPDLWRELYIYSMLGADFDRHWARLAGEAEAGKTLPFAVVARGAVCGMSTYLDIDPHNRTVEIGATYYLPGARGREINPAAKRLLLGHAFAQGARRVQFRVDAVNARSRAAVLKLGAVQEGILRNDKLTWTGRVRSTVVFSVLSEDWPDVRERLDARLSAFA